MSETKAVGRDHRDRLEAMAADGEFPGGTWDLSRRDVAAIRWVLGELDRLTAELAAVTAAWPTGSAASPWRDHEGRWWVDVPRSGPHPTRAAAVRAAAGLGAERVERVEAT